MLGEDGLKRKAEYIFYTELSATSKPQNSSTSEDDILYDPTLIGV